METIHLSFSLCCFNRGSKILVVERGRKITYESWIYYLVIIVRYHLSAKGQKSDGDPEGHVFLHTRGVQSLAERRTLIVVVKDTDCDVSRCRGFTLRIVGDFRSLNNRN